MKVEITCRILKDDEGEQVHFQSYHDEHSDDNERLAIAVSNVIRFLVRNGYANPGICIESESDIVAKAWSYLFLDEPGPTPPIVQQLDMALNRHWCMTESTLHKLLLSVPRGEPRDDEDSKKSFDYMTKWLSDHGANVVD